MNPPGRNRPGRTVRAVGSTRLRDLRNLGPVSEAALTAAGVTTPQQLDELGPAAAYRLLLEHGHRPHTTMLWALAGALLDLDWRDLPADLKTQLLAEATQTPDHRPSR
jgi:DNA transformation protein